MSQEGDGKQDPSQCSNEGISWWHILIS